MGAVGPPWDDPIALLQALVRIPSVNPDGDPGTGPENLGEARMADFVARVLRDCGADVVLEEVLQDRPNVIGRFPGREGKPRLLLGPHLDTVGVGGMTVDPFGGDRRDGRIYGRGACDTKGTMAAMLVALWELRDRISDLAYGVDFVGFMSEETGQDGSRHFAKAHGEDYAFALIGEPTEMAVVHTHKSCTWLEFSAEGKAAHASAPEKGDNAIQRIAALVTALDTKFRPLLAERGGKDSVLGRSTLNVGMISGGTRTNIVPEGASIQVDVRGTPALEEAGGVQPLLRDWLAGSQVGEGIRFRVLGESMRPLETDPAHPLVVHLAGVGNGLTGAPWFCDAALLAAVGIPAVAAGPGDIAQAHTADEWISVDQLEDGVRFYREFLTGLPEVG